MEAEITEFQEQLINKRSQRRMAEQSFLQTNSAWNEDITTLTQEVEELRRVVKQAEDDYNDRKRQERERKLAEAEKQLQLEIECARLGLYGKALTKQEKRLLEQHRKQQKKGKRR